MAFAVAVGDIVSPIVYAGFAASTQPPPQGTVTSIAPATVVLWQDGSEVTYTASTYPGSVDSGLSKFQVDVNSPLLNKKVRPLPTGAFNDFSNIDHRAEGVVVLAGNATNAVFTDLAVAIVRLNSNGLYVVLIASEIEVIPGA